MPTDGLHEFDRRTFLAAVGAIAGSTSVAGCSATSRDDDADTTAVSEDRALELAEQYAPTLYFDTHEKWFPTDPRPYESGQDGETIVDGFDAFDGYTKQSKESDEPPSPTVFYHAVEYAESPLAVIQFWYYSAFDQFTTNFHWHDWEVLHVFVDTDSDEPQLYVASSHSGKVPNNEFLDPEPDRVPRILSELGSHSSALSVNDVEDRFQRFSVEGTFADITNTAIEGLEDIANIPIAYGLPRDEGSRLPYLEPELDGAPIYEHERLPAVERIDLIDSALTVGSFSDLTSPPTDLPKRDTGLVFKSAGRDGEADVEYDLVPSEEVEHITDFAGPQLSFEFAVPQFAEDALSGHISTSGVPWNQPRYEKPAEDITEPNHRAALADRYAAIADPPPINNVVASMTESITSDEAPEDEGLTTQELTVETIALLESEPEAVPTFGGIAVVQDVPAGDHQLTVNGAGVEPHSESVAVGDDEPLTVAGVEGNIPLVARENSTKLEVDADGADSDLSNMAVEDDFAGRIYDAPLSGPDAVYLHQGGAYTTEVKDTDEEIGAYRVNPGTERRVRLDEPRTGKEPLAEYLADVAEETSAAVSAVSDGDDTDETQGSDQATGSVNAIQGLARALDAVAEAARRAAERAAASDREQADRSLATVKERLTQVQNRLAEASDQLPDELERANEHRLEQLDRRSDQAQAAKKL